MIGVLYPDGSVDVKHNIFDAMWSFLNGRNAALNDWFPVESKPVMLVQEQEDGSWGRVKPTPDQLKKCRQAISTWEMYHQSDREYRY